jgi:hypothetical protein
MLIGDCSAGGISGQVEQVVMVGILDLRKPGRFQKRIIDPIPDSECGSITPQAKAPAVILVYRDMGGKRVCHVEPLEPAPRSSYMSGGTFVDGDSRFSNLVGFYGAVAFHDRSE